MTRDSFIINSNGKSWFKKAVGRPRLEPKGIRTSHTRKLWRESSAKYYIAHKESILEKRKSKVVTE